MNQMFKYVIVSLILPSLGVLGYGIWHIYKDLTGYPDIDIQILIGEGVEGLDDEYEGY